MEPDAVRQVFAGRLVRVDVESWSGRSIDVVRHPGAAAVLPVTSDDQVILVRQFRPPIRRTSTEIPAGILDRPDEDPLTCAARELFEETGYRHTSIEFLGGIYTSAGFTDEYVHLFLAETEGEPTGAPEEGIELQREPFDAMVGAASSGRVSDAKTALALLLAAERRAPRGPTARRVR